MKKGLISWLVKNHIEKEADIDKILGALAFLVKQDGTVKVQGANTVFDKMLGWTNYLWSQGLTIDHIMTSDSEKRLCDVLDKSAQKLFVEFVENVKLKTLMGNIMTCRVHVCCIASSGNTASFLMRVSYDKKSQIKDLLFTEALRQSRVNCWYWDMNQGAITFFNTDVPETPYEGIPFMNEDCISFENFPQGLMDSITFAGDYRNVFMDFVKKILAHEQVNDLSVELALESGNAGLVWVGITGQIVRDEKNTPEYVMGTWKNITDQKTSEQHNSYVMGTLVKDSIYDITINLDKNFFVADNSLEKWMEETRVFSPFYDQAIRELVNERVIKSDRQEVLDFFSLDTLRNLPEDENFSIEYQRKYNGKMNWFKVTINTFRLDEFSDKWMYALVYDIDEAKRREIVLEKMAATDALTGLCNRAHSLELMEEYIGTHENMQTAVMYMDLDNFKSVNDTLGHAAGDSMLICVANAMRSYFGDDAVLGRIGGDEFIMMYLNADRSYIEQMMNDFVNYVGDKCHKECPEIPVTASLGYVMCPDFGTDISALVHLADKALYVAKHHGKNTAVEYKG